MKKVLFYGFLLILLIPMLKQLGVIPINDRELSGNYTTHSFAEFNFHNWYHGIFQEKAEPALNDRVGFRGVATRLRNQIDYSLFDFAHSDKAIVGKNDILFDEWYLNAWQGRTFIGEDVIDIKLWKLKMLQDTLKKRGTDLLFILAPDKADFFSDKIPEYYSSRKLPQNNYTYLSKRMKEMNIRHIDMNPYFLAMKDTIQHALYPKSGIHWSKYGAWVALDTMISSIEYGLHTDLNNIYVDSIESTMIPRHPDNDIGQNINLLCRASQWELSYPYLSFEQNPAKEKPRMLVSGDSYYFNIYTYDFTPALFSNNTFWYYAHWVYPECYKETFTADELNLRQEVESMDEIVLMVTLRFMHNIDWKFIDKVFEFYYPGILWKKNYNKITDITVDHSYFYWLLDKAEKQGKKLETVLDGDATYLINHEKEPPVGKSVFDFVQAIYNNEEMISGIREYCNTTGHIERNEVIREALDQYLDYRDRVNKVITEINNDENWLNSVREKAQGLGVSAEYQVRRDAIYVVEQIRN